MTPSISFVPTAYSPSARHYLIFFITGNPGLISYYNTFLSTLQLLLESRPDSPSNAFHIFGRSFDGFEDDVVSQDQSQRSEPFGLSEQIDLTFDALLRAQRIAIGPRKGQKFDGIILMGHSVGSFVLLEILQMARKSTIPDTLPRIVAGFLLFPTVTHIAKSPSGVKLTTLLRIPNFVVRASKLVKGLMWVLPWGFVKGLVGVVARMPNDAAAVTTAFLKSKNGVWQALHMAQDEMAAMTEDKWDEEIWGVEHSDPESKAAIPKLVFYWGTNDHWIADSSRDALIAARGQKDADPDFSTRPKMVMDEHGIPHAFCIRHSEVMAEKVKVWIDEIIEIDRM